MQIKSPSKIRQNAVLRKILSLIASNSGVEGHEFESRRVYHFFLPFSPQNPGSEAFLLFAAESCKMVQIE